MDNKKHNFIMVSLTLLGLFAASVFYFQVLPQSVEFELKSSSVRVGKGDRPLEYYFYAPENIVQGQKYPLVLLMHGGTGYTPYTGQYLTQSAYLKRYPAFIIAPKINPLPPYSEVWSYPVRTANPQKLGVIVKEIVNLTRSYPIDTKRIYAYGCSLGGAGVYGASKSFDYIFAAGVSVSGFWDENTVSNMNKMPMYILAGTQDKITPVSSARRMRDRLKQIGAPVQYKEFNVGHNCPSKNFHTSDIFDWLFAQRLR